MAEEIDPSLRTPCARPALADLVQCCRGRHSAVRNPAGRRRSFRWCKAGVPGSMPTPRSAGRLASFRDRPRSSSPSDRTPPTPVSQVVWTPKCCRFSRAPMPERGRAKVEEVCVACHGETGVSISPDFPHLAGQSGRGDLQAAVRLSDGQPHASADDGPCQGAGRTGDRRRRRLLCRPAEAQSKSGDVGTILARYRAAGRAGRSPPQYPAVRVMPPPGIGRADRDADPGRANARVPRSTIEAVRIRRAAQ